MASSGRRRSVHHVKPAKVAQASIGHYQPALYTSGLSPDIVSLFNAEKTKIGREPRYQSLWVSWQDTDFGNGIPTTQMNEVRSRGSIPYITWEFADAQLAFPTSSGVTQSAFQLADINAGTYDTYIQSWATGLKNWTYPVVIRLFHEWNALPAPWSPGYNGNAAGTTEIINAWRRIVGIFQTTVATNVKWHWCVWSNTDPTSWSGGYPGDAYVDYTGADVYNGFIAWRTFTQCFASDYDYMTQTTAPSKPVWIGEMGCKELSGQDKAGWIRDTYLREMPRRFPRIQQVMYFDKDLSGSGQYDWRVNSTTGSLSAYQEVAAYPYWAL